jgi:hypothetical protein
MNEQIFLSGAPVVGFGASSWPFNDDPGGEKKFIVTGAGIPLLGWAVGAIGGGVVGYKSGKILGAVGGVVVGGIVGTATGLGIAYMILANATNEHNVGATTT